jgi:hypothetical protein
LIALFSPIFVGSDYNGLSGLMLGWMGLLQFDPYQGLPWIANIFYFFNLFVPNVRNRNKILISLATISLGLFTIGITEILIDEGGQKASVTVGVGFYLWIMSFMVLLVGQMIEGRGKASSQKRD